MEHFNKLTPAEAERLAWLAEECGEVVQAIGKVLRHGYESRPPEGGMTNRDKLTRELGDLMAAVESLDEAGDVGKAVALYWADYKKRTVGRWLHHAGENGR